MDSGNLNCKGAEGYKDNKHVAVVRVVKEGWHFYRKWFGLLFRFSA